MTLLSTSTEQSLRAEIERLREQVAALTERAERAEALADRDVLTPTLNRRGFVDHLSRSMSYCRRHGIDAALLYLDLDGFKTINDDLGHAAGDQALLAVSAYLTGQVRESDAVGRLGGDEFALLLMNADASASRDKAERLMAGLSELAFEWQGQACRLGGSIGVRALGTQADAEVWLAEADTDMWLRKADRRTAR